MIFLCLTPTCCLRCVGFKSYGRKLTLSYSPEGFTPVCGVVLRNGSNKVGQYVRGLCAVGEHLSVSEPSEEP